MTIQYSTNSVRVLLTSLFVLPRCRALINNYSSLMEPEYTKLHRCEHLGLLVVPQVH